MNYEHEAVLTVGHQCRHGRRGVDSRFVEIKLRLAVLCLVAAEGLEAGDATVNEHNIYWSNSMTSSSVNESSNSRTAQFHKHGTSLYSS